MGLDTGSNLTLSKQLLLIYSFTSKYLRTLMPKFYIYIRQNVASSGSCPRQEFKGFVDPEASELVSEIRRAGRFDLSQVKHIVESHEYELCTVTAVELKRAELDIGLVDNALGIAIRHTHKSGCTSVPEAALKDLAQELQCTYKHLETLWVAGLSVFIEYINKEIESYN
jgi:hypothetical protein